MVKPGVLRACLHIHADPLLIHQAALLQWWRIGCLIFGRIFSNLSAVSLLPPLIGGTRQSHGGTRFERLANL